MTPVPPVHVESQGVQPGTDGVSVPAGEYSVQYSTYRELLGLCSNSIDMPELEKL